MRRDHEVAARRDDRFAERRNELPALQVAVDQRHAAQRDALPGDRRRNQLVVRREVEDAGGAQVGEFHRLQPEAPVLELVAAVGLHPQQRVGGEIGRSHERRIRRPQQARAAHRGDRLAEQANAVLGPGRSHRPVADADVDAVAIEVDELVARRDANVDARMVGDEARQARDQPEAGESRRRRDDDGLRPLAVADRARRGVESTQCLEGGRIERRAVLGQGERAVQAAKERNAETVLEGEHLAADRRLGERDLGAGAGEAEMAGGALEGDQELEGRQLEEPVAHFGSHAWHACKR